MASIITERILVATNNPGKLREIHALLDDLPVELVSPKSLGIGLEVEETGETYAENAALKAAAFCRRACMLTLADDSGLEVDALAGAPGVHSHRFDPRPGATDPDRRRLLVQRLSGRPRPWTARFRCVVALARPAGSKSDRSAVKGAAVQACEVYPVEYFEGICPGVIIPEERGDNGFGYDPIFLLSESGLTMAELSMTEKNLLSHRARAILAARPRLLELLDIEKI